jgi:hypothetical protein
LRGRTGSTVRLLLLAVLVAGVAAAMPLDLSLPSNLLGPVAAFTGMQPGAPLPPDWQAVDLQRGATLWSIVADPEVGACLRGESAGEASGLQLVLGGDAADARRLHWTWRSEGPVEGSDLRRQEADDAPARVTVSFDFEPPGLSRWDRLRHGLARRRLGSAVPGAALSYVWGNAEAVDSVFEGAYTSRVRVVVLRNADDPRDMWVGEERDLEADFRRAFGGEMPAVIGIGLLTDADDTGGRAAACYGDLVLLREPTDAGGVEPAPPSLH